MFIKSRGKTILFASLLVVIFIVLALYRGPLQGRAIYGARNHEIKQTAEPTPVASEGRNVNTVEYVVDESVSIPEPVENIGRVPDHIRWEPMLGLYILKDAYYDSSTRSFIFPDHCFPEDAEDMSDHHNEKSRIDVWISTYKPSNNELYNALVQYYQTRTDYSSFSSIRKPGDHEVINTVIIPLGVPYLDNMLDMVMKQKMFDVPLTYSIEQMMGVTCQPSGMSYDDYEWTHDRWRESMQKLLSDVEIAVINHEELDPYGLFALPYLVTHDKNRLDSYLSKYNELLHQNGLLMEAEDQEEWILSNQIILDEIQKCVEKYR